MERLILSPRELKYLIDHGTFVGKGVEGSVFTYQNRLIKLDNILYNLLKKHPIEEADKLVSYRYLGGKEYFNDPDQIDYLSNSQKDIHLTKLPHGVVELKGLDIIPGIIIPYHRNYQKLETLSKQDLEKVLPILKKLLLASRELEEHQISHEDLYHPEGNGKVNYNIMYKDKTPQLIDVSGPDVRYGKKYKDARSMYIELGQVIIDFFEGNGYTHSFDRWYTDTFEKNEKLIEELAKQARK